MGRSSVLAKVAVQRLLNLAGYRLERLILPHRPVDVFELAVRKVALERGAGFFFVQIGANDGVRDDPIKRLVEEYHWAGLLVEPQPRVFEQLQRNYANEHQLRFENAAIGPATGTKTLYTVEGEGFATALASYRRDLLVAQLPAGTKIVELQVPTLTLDGLLSRHEVREIDLLQIDVEGYDYEVLKMLDFDKFRPAVIHYEHRHLSDGDRRDCERLLTHRGYRLHVTGLDSTAIIQG